MVASKICYGARLPFGSLRFTALGLDPQIIGRGGLFELETSGSERSDIIRVYEVPAENRIQATERMLEALDLHVERYFHVKDYIREPGEKAEKGRRVDLRPAAGWVQLFLEQLGLIKK